MTFITEDGHNILEGRVLLALPKKGRLAEPTMTLMKGADIKFTRKNRLDIALCTDINVAIVFLPAADIPSFVGMGNVDLGITGQDVIAESGVDVFESLTLGYGKCKLCVQVPRTSSIKNINQLCGKRIVTSFERITKQFLDQQLGDNNQTQVAYVGGSVEAACALGLSDAIVDLVESGETMAAAGLYPINTILTSEAVLIKNANSSLDPKKSELLELLESRIKGIVIAQKHYLVKYNIKRTELKLGIQITPGNRAASIMPLEDEGWVAVEAMIKKSDSANVLDQLKQVGATDIILFSINNCRV